MASWQSFPALAHAGELSSLWMTSRSCREALVKTENAQRQEVMAQHVYG